MRHLGVALGLLLMCGVSSAGEPLTQADKDWLHRQCDNPHTYEDCSTARTQLLEQGKQVGLDDMLRAHASLQKSETRMADKEWLTASCSFQGRLDICESSLKKFKAEGKTLPPDEEIEICVKAIKTRNPRSTFDAYAENGQV